MEEVLWGLPELLCEGGLAAVLVEVGEQADLVAIVGPEGDLEVVRATGERVQYSSACLSGLCGNPFRF